RFAVFDDYVRDRAALAYKHRDEYFHQSHQSLVVVAVRSSFDSCATTRPYHWSILIADVRHRRTARAITRNQNRRGNVGAQTTAQFVYYVARPILAAISRYHE